MKKIFTLLLILLAFTSCSNDDDDTPNPVVGTWKLVKGEILTYTATGAGTATIDYSDENIKYTFDSNSNLTINTNGTLEAFKYEFKIDYLSGFPDGETKTPLVVIDDSKWTYAIVDGKMKLGKSYVDGEDLFFEKQ